MFVWLIWPEELLYDGEHNLLALAEFLVCDV